MRHFFIVTCLLLAQQAYPQNNDTHLLKTAMQQFEEEYYTFNLPALTLDFKTNLTNELSTKNAVRQQAFFQKMASTLEKIDPDQLNHEMAIEYQVLRFETTLNLKRLALLGETPEALDVAPLEKIHDFSQGAAWYAWFIKKWTGTTQSPEQIMAFGKTEVERVKKAIAALDLSQPKPASDFTSDTNLIVKRLTEKRNHINAQLPELLPDFRQLPPLNIRQGTNSRLAQTPGYYNGNTFYFNLFEQPFDLADCDWLLIHEGNPGHHFQVNYHNELTVPSYRSGLRNMGFVEGWAAYTENLGWEMELYEGPYEALGKWNWDLIRSVRIVLDVALNYHGWSDEQCMDYWQQHIKNQDDIARREIARMKRWPAQVLTYKLGEATLLSLLKAEKERLGTRFDYKTFHSAILNSGPVPVSVIPKLIKGDS